jgi:hypothetical protein
MSSEGPLAVRVILERSYWFVLIGFAVILAAFTRDRACFDHLNLLPSIAARAGLAWLAGLVYLSGYGWIATAYLFTVSRTGKLIPGASDVHSIAGAGLWRVGLLLALVAADYLPLQVVRRVGSVLGLCG